jgi:hypothetical protein
MNSDSTLPRPKLDPLTLVVTVLTIGFLLVTLNKTIPWIAPGIFLISCCGMLAIGFVRLFERRHSAHAVDYQRLAQINFLHCVSWLKQNLRGHDDTVDQIATAVHENLGLAIKGRVLGAFLLVGPTGSGKTFLAQLIAKALYPESEPIFLPLNECKHSADVNVLIGPPPGSAGYEVGGQLTRPVLENPYRVIILDEIEKCHPNMHDCLYGILDTAGCVEKSSRRAVDFSGCLFFATCNAGADALRALKQCELKPSEWPGKSKDVLVREAGFQKAFLSRWSGIYLLDELQPIHVAEVACLQLAKHWRDYGIELVYAEPAVIMDSVQRNEDFKQYGVRQLRTYIEQQTGPAINRARKGGAKQVRLGITQEGVLTVEPIYPHPAPSASPTASEMPPDSLTKKCPYCGKRYSNDWVSCVLDNTPLQPLSTPATPEANQSANM